MSGSYCPGTQASKLCWTLCCLSETFLLLATSCLGLSLARSGKLSGGQDFWWLLMLGPTTSRSPRCLMWIRPRLFLLTGSSALCELAMLEATSRDGFVVVDAGLGGSAHVRHGLPPAPAEGPSYSLLPQRCWRDWKGRASQGWKGHDQGQMSGWVTGFSEVTAAQPAVTTRSEGAHVPSAPGLQVPAEDEPAAPSARATERVRTPTGLKLFLYRLGNRKWK